MQPATPQAHGIFISYRRRDTSFPAGWLYERLISHFGQAHIFKDVDSIQPGDDFVDVITRSVLACHTMLVLIGPSWQVTPSGSGPPSADAGTDFVRLEVETALSNGLRVIPILVEDAQMPMERDLPASMEFLARRNAVVLNPNHFDAGFKRLVPVLERARDDAEQRAEEERLRATRHAKMRQTRPPDPPPREAGRPTPAPRVRPVENRLPRTLVPPPDQPEIQRDPKADVKWRRVARASRPIAVAAVVVLAVGYVLYLSLPPRTGTGVTSSTGAKPIVGLITKTDTNPFFVKMKEGAQQAADAAGVTLQSFAGKTDGDNQSQVQAIESLIAAGAKGILITPSDSKAIVPEIDKAKQAGMLVVALDTPTDPPDAVDGTFATDNLQAGILIGEWAKSKLGAQAAYAKIAMLDLSADQVSVDIYRDQGFMQGFGINVGDPNKIGDENDPRIVGHDVTQGAEDGGRTAMENLLQKDPSINLVYTINEPAASGAYQALKAAGKDKSVTIVSIDGGCPGVQAVKAGQIGATSQQYPLKMAQQGVEAVVAFAKDGTKPQATSGKTFTDTGVTLITDEAQSGVDSKDTPFGLANCWG